MGYKQVVVAHFEVVARLTARGESCQPYVMFYPAKGELKIQSVSPERASVLDAVHQMNQYKIAAVLVMNDDQVVGIFTEARRPPPRDGPRRFACRR